MVAPFDCGALILLDKEDRAKFQTRCVLLIFIHYATTHPLYTYAFFSPRSKRVIYRQDSITLATTFSVRTARVNAGLPEPGEPLIAFRSPLASALGSHEELSFNDWQTDDDLPPTTITPLASHL